MTTSNDTTRLHTLEEHQAFLKEVFTTAQHRVVIVSPFISINAIVHDGIDGLVKSALSRGIDVRVFVDHKLNCIDSELKQSALDGIVALTKAGVKVAVVDGIHNKTLIRDNDLIAEGSFNWLSAVRIRNGECQREERTLVCTGISAKEMIDRELNAIEAMDYGFAEVKARGDEDNSSNKLKLWGIAAVILAIPLIKGDDWAGRIFGVVITTLMLAGLAGLYLIKERFFSAEEKGDSPVVNSGCADELSDWEIREYPGQFCTTINNASGSLPGGIVGDHNHSSH